MPEALKCNFATLLVTVFQYTAFEGLFVIMTLPIWICHMLKSRSDLTDTRFKYVFVWYKLYVLDRSVIVKTL